MNLEINPMNDTKSLLYIRRPNGSITDDIYIVTPTVPHTVLGKLYVNKIMYGDDTISMKKQVFVAFRYTYRIRTIRQEIWDYKKIFSDEPISDVINRVYHDWRSKFNLDVKIHTDYLTIDELKYLVYPSQNEGEDTISYMGDTRHCAIAGLDTKNPFIFCKSSASDGSGMDYMRFMFHQTKSGRWIDPKNTQEFSNNKQLDHIAMSE